MKLNHFRTLRGLAMSMAASVAAIILTADGVSAGATYLPGFSGGDKFTPMIGGKGGGSFQARCADPSFLVGLEVTQDSRIKSVKPLCATLQGDHFGTPLRSPLEFGSPTAERYSRVCPNGGSPNAIFVYADGYDVIGVWEIQLRCANTRGDLPIGDPPKIAFIGMQQQSKLNSSPKDASGSAECPAGYISKGVFGRYGTFIDAIGLICGWPGPPPVADAPAAAPVRPDTCKPGYVWRLARPSDHVCVVVVTREQAAIDNAAAASRWVSPADHTCKPGFVWREAFRGDDVCVQPDIRTQTLTDNAAARSRRIGP